MPDLVIGGRRAGTPRPWRSGAIAVAMLGVALIVAWFVYRRSVAYDMPAGEVRGALSHASQTVAPVASPGAGAAAAPAPGSPATLAYAGSSLSWAGGVPVLRVAGEPHALGAAHGRLLAPWLAPVLRATLPSIAQTVSTTGLLGGPTHAMRLAWRWRFVDDGLADPDRRMIAGLARGAAASSVALGYDDLVRAHAVLDVGAPSARTAEADEHTLARSLTVIAQQQQAPARIWIARTFALPGLDDGGDAALPVVTIAHPTGKIAWAGVGWPGALGVVSGVNANGIAVMVHPARTADVRLTRTARPVALLARAVLEQATTLDEAIKLIEATPTLGSAALVIADGTAGTWAVVERTPTKAVVERHPAVPALGDVLTTNALAADPENDRARRVLPTTSRSERAARLVRAPLADVAAVAAVLRDQRAVDDAPRPPGHRGAIDDGRAVHALILDPASLELWVADPRAGGRMRAFDLRHELRRDGDRPAPPADIPADASADPDRAATLAAARADLRIARAALAAGNRERASEACARARVRAPSLPEALELDAQVAQARGDLSGARAAFQAWLDAGPDDPKQEQRARAMIAR